ncbi:MAG: BPSS1780 family membrane protein [Thiobacillus sp.]
MSTSTDEDIPRKLNARQGLQWVNEGWRLYRGNPLLLSAAFGLLFGAVAIVSLVPIIGNVLSELISPLMVAGFMAAYRVLDRKENLQWQNFLAGIQGPWLPLMVIGAVQMLGMLIITQIMLRMGFDGQAVMAAAQKNDAVALQAALNQSTPALLTGLLLFIPLIMATWFAPALILFGNARPGQALIISLRAVVKNILPIIVNGLALGLVLFIAALIPLMLGFLVAMPVVFGSLYSAYQGIFAVWAEEGVETSEPAGIVD